MCVCLASKNKKTKYFELRIDLAIFLVDRIDLAQIDTIDQVPATKYIIISYLNIKKISNVYLNVICFFCQINVICINYN